jgi:hypothetical protein
VPTLTALPTAIIAGDSYDITLSVAAYPASAGWSVRLSLAGPDTLDKASSPVGDAHRFVLTTTDTAALTAGLYRLRLRAEKDAGATAETYHTGTLPVEQDIGVAAPGELQSYAERMLAICKLARESVLAGESKMFMIDGRQMMFHSLAELAKEEAHWRRELATERRGSAFQKRRVTFVRG